MHYKPTVWDLSTQTAIKMVEETFHQSLHAEKKQALLKDPPPGEPFQSLRMRGTGFYEPDCKYDWCSLAKVWPPVSGNVAAGSAPGVVTAEGEGMEGPEL